MIEVRCTGCNRRLLSYDTTSFRRYRSPLKKCKKCGEPYVDPRCHELAVEGMPSDTFSVKSYAFLIILGMFFAYRGIHTFGLHQLGVAEEIQWLLPCFLILAGSICILGGIYEIIAILTGIKKKKFERLYRESEARLRDESYRSQLRQLGYEIPERTDNQEERYD